MAEDSVSTGGVGIIPMTRDVIIRLNQLIREEMKTRITEILGRYGISDEDASTVADEIATAYGQVCGEARNNLK